MKSRVFSVLRCLLLLLLLIFFWDKVRYVSVLVVDLTNTFLDLTRTIHFSSE